MSTGRIVINDPDFIGPLYYIEQDDWRSPSAGPLGFTTMSRKEASMITEEQSQSIIDQFHQSYYSYFGFDSIEAMRECGITIAFEVGE